MEKAYFEGKVIDLWDNALIVEESLPSEDQDEEAVDGTEVNCDLYIFYIAQAKAAKRLANKEQANEEKAKQEDNLTQSKDIMAISDESMVQ
ncbi:hypothetical protein OS493_019401 [Desmophyllum pertusum]|uniref:Uncharacterized protein n=1 Tax=Desmophyllum pertusum TaxID=174260 RepID=A0A9X0A463_9CNID|nr:hypothetical protein OS493_019401 [Desmophyllum pertusum]